MNGPLEDFFKIFIHEQVVSLNFTLTITFFQEEVRGCKQSFCREIEVVLDVVFMMKREHFVSGEQERNPSGMKRMKEIAME